MCFVRIHASPEQNYLSLPPSLPPLLSTDLAELAVEVGHDRVYEVVSPRGEDKLRLELQLLLLAVREVQRQDRLAVRYHRLPGVGGGDAGS